MNYEALFFRWTRLGWAGTVRFGWPVVRALWITRTAVRVVTVIWNWWDITPASVSVVFVIVVGQFAFIKTRHISSPN